MAIETNHIKSLIHKLEALPAERLDEVEDFIDFLKQRNQDRRLTHSTTQVAEGSFAQVWDNTDDAVYDRL